MTAAFFSNTSELFQQCQGSNDKNIIPDEDLLEYFELNRCANWIQQNAFKQVALQFPDELLRYSTAIASYLATGREATGVKVFILADTSFGSCCADEVAAEHRQADSLIHFGHACLTPTSRLPVLYIFGCAKVDVPECVRVVSELVPSDGISLLLLADVEYQHEVGNIGKRLKDIYGKVALSSLNITLDKHHCKVKQLAEEESNTGVVCIKKLGKTLELYEESHLEDYTVLYVGHEEKTLTNWMMTLNKCTFYSYNPVTNIGQRAGLHVNKLLMKRYYQIERAKDASIVGILVGTLGVKNYLDIIAHLKTILCKAGKKSYVFAVGKVNVAKLANFQDVDIFVLVACPENTIIDSSEFYQPIVTPYEMEIACNQARQWTGDYVTDFSELLPGAAHHLPMGDVQEIQTDVSLVTGRIRQLGTEDNDTIPGVELVSQGTKAITTASERLTERSWMGLEEKLGQTTVKKAIDGSSGIAMGYSNEPQDYH